MKARNSDLIEMNPIGIIHSAFKSIKGMPIQPAGAEGVKGTVHVFEQYRQGLQDLESFSHVILIYQFHRTKGYDLLVVPFLDTKKRGVFATRAPKRPNPIGLSIVLLDKIEDGVLHVRNIDILDGTPLLDIKPYVSIFDSFDRTRNGWLHNKDREAARKTSDNRFDEC